MSGLSHRSITDNDIRDSIRSIRGGQRNLDEVLELEPENMGHLIELLEERGTYVVGQVGEGVIGMGETLSPGYQRIIRYFESILWNLNNPEAAQHPSRAVFGNNAEFVQLWGEAESKRLGIIVNELRDEAERRGILGDL